MLATQDSFGKEGLGKNLKRKHTSSAENDAFVLILRYRIAHSHDVSTDSFDLRPAVMLDRTFLGSHSKWLTTEILTPGIYPRLLVMHIYEQ